MEIINKIVKLKNNEIICLKLTEVNGVTSYFNISAYNNLEQRLGQANFKIDCKKVFLYKIWIENANYHSKGVGTQIISLLEEFAKQNYCNFIEGKFYPEGLGAQNAKSFYFSKGYSIEKEDYDTLVYKML